MNRWPRFPLVLEINALPWLASLSRQYKQRITLGSIPQPELDALAKQGFHALWLMGVWQRSSGSKEIAARIEDLRDEYQAALPDFTPEDVAGSPYAISGYRVDTRLGDEAQLRQLRRQLHDRQLRLILDFIPNHFAIDHDWLQEHPQRLVQGTAMDLKIAPQNYFSVTGEGGTKIFAHGKPPFGSGWTDTVQLDYRQPETRQAMIAYLLQIAGQCDGVRCDMAMLVLKEVFCKTWPGACTGDDTQFWEAAIKQVKSSYPEFLFIGEVYWDYEYRMQKLGFDFVYDKILYDRVLGKNPRSVYDHLHGGNTGFQEKLVRFIENHDERRVAHLAGLRQGLAAAAIVLTLPGLRLVHEGQSTGYTLKLPVQLGRRAVEPPEKTVCDFYARLYKALQRPLFQTGRWQLLQPRKSSPDNESYVNFIAFLWQWGEELSLLVANLFPGNSQCFLPLPVKFLENYNWLLQDELNDYTYHRNGAKLITSGLFLDLPGYGYHLFRVCPDTGETMLA